MIDSGRGITGERGREKKRLRKMECIRREMKAKKEDEEEGKKKSMSETEYR